MKTRVFNLFLVTIIVGAFVACANRGTPTGGEKDETPPVIIKAVPENKSTHFQGHEIKIFFDEYIKLKNLKKQLIISPPMKIAPEIRPLGGANNYISIQIKDTLKPETTYAFNFGNSIEDNNEGNTYPYFRYVFSTGSYIDSLSVKGRIVDALKPIPETFVNVGLYEIDSTFTDSIIYKSPPKYITNTLDSLTTFQIENVKAGTYLLMALKDRNGDNKYQQRVDDIAFHKTYITLPTDSLFTLKLFKEISDFKPARPSLMAKQKIVFGYEGDSKGSTIEVLSKVPENFEYRITKDPEKDSLYYWYKPQLTADSLVFKWQKKQFEKNYTVRLSKQKPDSLRLAVSPTGNIGVKTPLSIYSSTPLLTFDPSKTRVIDKDSTRLEFTTTFDTIANTYALQFDKKADDKYTVEFLPEAFTDFFGAKNKDTLNYVLQTRKLSDFGNIRFQLQGASYPLILELTNTTGEIVASHYVEAERAIDFLSITPGIYRVRVIFDKNGNRKYDTGNYLKKIQPETVNHFELSDEVRADFDVVEILKFKPPN